MLHVGLCVLRHFADCTVVGLGATRLFDKINWMRVWKEVFSLMWSSILGQRIEDHFYAYDIETRKCLRVDNVNSLK